LTTKSSAALSQPQAISGLGGIGKTQTAIEYAHRYQNDYQHIFWVRADTPETLTSDLVSIAGLLNLKEKEAQGQTLIIAAVKRWLESHPKWLLIKEKEAQDQTLIIAAVKRWLESHPKWLLIFDNADDL